MGAVNSTHALIALSAVAVAYALWMMYFTMRESRRADGTGRKDKGAAPSSGDKRMAGDIVGKSRFVLPVSGQSRPEAAVAAETESDTEKENSFAPANVPEHPRQIAPDELDEVFGQVPEGETNEPLDMDFPLYESFPEEDRESMEDSDFGDDEDENEDYPYEGKSYAQGVSYDQLGDAYRHVVHDPEITVQQKEETGRILLNLKGTDMYGAIVSGNPEREDKITSLIDTYLSAFDKRIAGESAQSPPVQGAFPPDFDVREYV